MKTRVYYGEYTLKHWINLMLSGNIVLPDYQRSFVWEQKDVMKLIESLKEGQFVQPVTIAQYHLNQKHKNLILDGQQRLTSILLYCLDLFPKKESFVYHDAYADEDDSAFEEASSDNFRTTILGWTYSDMLDKNWDKNTLSDLRKRLNNDLKYEKLKNTHWDSEEIDKFLDETYLGFSYIIPSESNKSDDKKYFSTLFRNMNYLGKKLSPLESRRSLYFLNENLINFFDGKTKTGADVFNGVGIIDNLSLCKLDIVRYLATLSQYSISLNKKKVLCGYSAYKLRENYYADYVSYIMGLEQEDRIDKFDGFDIKKIEWESGYEKISEAIQLITPFLSNKDHAFSSWIDADYWLFGLIYWILFKGKEVTITQILTDKMVREIKDKKMDLSYSKTPNLLMNLRERLVSSINLYENYAIK